MGLRISKHGKIAPSIHLFQYGNAHLIRDLLLCILHGLVQLVRIIASVLIIHIQNLLFHFRRNFYTFKCFVTLCFPAFHYFLQHFQLSFRRKPLNNGKGLHLLSKLRTQNGNILDQLSGCREIFPLDSFLNQTFSKGDIIQRNLSVCELTVEIGYGSIIPHSVHHRVCVSECRLV